MKCIIHKGHGFPHAVEVAVVIDVLRAFTTAAYAFAAGAQEIQFVSTAEEAFAQFEEDRSLLLMGESEGSPIAGFHYENSPYEIANAPLCGRRLVQRTTSGTQGVVGSPQAKYLLVSSFAIAEATVGRIKEIGPSSVAFVVTGRNNGDEDAALAEYLQERLSGGAADLEGSLQRVRNSPAARRLVSGDRIADLELALQADRFSFAIEVSREAARLVGRRRHIG